MGKKWIIRSTVILLVGIFGCGWQDELNKQAEFEAEAAARVRAYEREKTYMAFKKARMEHLGDANLDPRIKSCIERGAICTGMTLEDIRFAMTDWNPNFGKFIMEDSYGNSTYEFAIGNYKAAWVNFEDGKAVSWTIYEDRYNYPP